MAAVNHTEPVAHSETGADAADNFEAFAARHPEFARWAAWRRGAIKALSADVR